MTRENIENTLFNLRRVVTHVKVKGLTVNRFIMGVELMEEINAKSPYVLNKNNGLRLFGTPIIIDYGKPYTLEVVTAHKVEVEGVG